MKRCDPIFQLCFNRCSSAFSYWLSRTKAVCVFSSGCSLRRASRAVLRFASGLLRLRFPGRLLFPFLLWFGEVPCSGHPFRGFRFAGSGPKWRPLRCGRDHRAATCRRWAGRNIRGCCCRPDYLKMRSESLQFRLNPSRPAPRTFYPQRVLRSTLSVRTSRLAAPGPLIRTADAECSGMGC